MIKKLLVRFNEEVEKFQKAPTLSGAYDLGRTQKEMTGPVIELSFLGAVELCDMMNFVDYTNIRLRDLGIITHDVGCTCSLCSMSNDKEINEWYMKVMS